jgi:hypothetical protein
VDAQELRRRARQEADEISPEPSDWHEREQWKAERHGAVVLLASVADWDQALPERAALETAGEWTNRTASELLLDAAQERR